MNHADIVARVSAYYTAKLEAFGETPQGVDWNSETAQSVRFDQVLSVVAPDQAFEINDIGCGYGALLEKLVERPEMRTYLGYDISHAMIEAARTRYASERRARFTDCSEDIPVADYTVASGIFSVKGATSVEDWERYVFDTIDLLRDRSRRGFSFNCLTTYSDDDRKRDDLYYGDPHVYFDRCRTRYARNVALLHDYGIYEFTIRVRFD